MTMEPKAAEELIQGLMTLQSVFDLGVNSGKQLDRREPKVCHRTNQ